MRARAAILLAALAASGALGALGAGARASDEGAQVVLPSGLEATLQEVLSGEAAMGLTVRFRFVAPEFTGQEDFETQTADLEYLCNDYALPRLDPAGAVPDRVVISLADRPSEFGQFDPDVAQIFESFSVSDAACILELF